MRKCGGIGAVAAVVAEAGVRMRRASAEQVQAAATSGKKRKVDDGEFEISTTRRCRRAVETPENSVSAPILANSRIWTDDPIDPCDGFNSDNLVESCTSSNGSSVGEREEESSPDYDFQFAGTKRRETTSPGKDGAVSDEQDSTAKPLDTNSYGGSTVEKMPTQAEIEEFFAPAEKNLQKRFIEKYNFDIVRDEPLEGRYEWRCLFD